MTERGQIFLSPYVESMSDFLQSDLARVLHPQELEILEELSWELDELGLDLSPVFQAFAQSRLKSHFNRSGSGLFRAEEETPDQSRPVKWRSSEGRFPEFLAGAERAASKGKSILWCSMYRGVATAPRS